MLWWRDAFRLTRCTLYLRLWSLQKYKFTFWDGDPLGLNEKGFLFLFNAVVGYFWYFLAILAHFYLVILLFTTLRASVWAGDMLFFQEMRVEITFGSWQRVFLTYFPHRLKWQMNFPKLFSHVVHVCVQDSGQKPEKYETRRVGFTRLEFPGFQF